VRASRGVPSTERGKSAQTALETRVRDNRGVDIEILREQFFGVLAADGSVAKQGLADPIIDCIDIADALLVLEGLGYAIWDVPEKTLSNMLDLHDQDENLCFDWTEFLGLILDETLTPYAPLGLTLAVAREDGRVALEKLLKPAPRTDQQRVSDLQKDLRKLQMEGNKNC